MIEFEADYGYYKTISILGQGFDGMMAVHLAKHLPTGRMIALKRFNMDRIKEEAHLVEREIILTRQLQHPNIISYYLAFVHAAEVWVVSSLMAYGSCKDLLTRYFNEGLPEAAIILILKDVLEALDYIHKKGFIHRAIRASHILISASGKACLTGLRYACPIVLNGKWQKTIHSFPSSTSSNLNWLSPELLEQNLQGYNEKSDMYSVGIVICELANGHDPFAGMCTTLMLTEKVRGFVPQLLDCLTIPPVDDLDNSGDSELSGNVRHRKFSEDLHDVADLCMQRESYHRPTPCQLLTHPLFKAHKKAAPLQDLLKPALPMSDRVAYNTDDVTNLENINKLSQMELYTCEWDF
ncbi:STE20-related kinase adapter protein alpha isoform X2 [Aethina tumida]|uniref:STE20-related kinase adapter protein alpha isoform X2 n=1 Tax=Aethina tumida TaxID=116153 RepID=UPI0021498199|nr:STE20-related kinase adapter protein alpha isoform X2 [Aethina tumida]